MKQALQAPTKCNTILEPILYSLGFQVTVVVYRRIKIINGQCCSLLELLQSTATHHRRVEASDFVETVVKTAARYPLVEKFSVNDKMHPHIRV